MSLASKQFVTSVVSYVGISESGHCGYCKSSQCAKAKLAATESDLGCKRQLQNVIIEGAGDEQIYGSTSTDNTQDKCKKDGANAVQEDTDKDKEGNSVVFGLIAHCLGLESFNKLLDLGWSRSGRYLYKPIMEKTCCPQYTIRLDIHKFRLSRTQKRVLRTMRDYLQLDRRPEEKAILREQENSRCRNKNNFKEQHKFHLVKQEKKDKKEKMTVEGIEQQPKKKEVRRKRAQDRLITRGINIEQYTKDRAAREEARRRTLQSYFDEYLDTTKQTQWKHKLEIRLVGQPSPELDEDFDEEFQLFRCYQISIHNDDPDELSINSFRRFLASSPLTTEKEITTHKAATSKQNFVSLGSYHQQYRLDGRIIAVGVIDILPHCLSAKYLFYDPNLAFLSLGTFSAIYEIAFTQQLVQQRPELHFYYMGFYLFDCPKMKYKGRFRPSDLLCDHCYRWVPLSECDQLLEQNNGRFCTFHPCSEPPRPEFTEQQLSQIKCIYAQHHLVTYGQLLASFDDDNNDSEQQEYREELAQKISNYAHYAGPAAFDIALAL